MKKIVSAVALCLSFAVGGCVSSGTMVTDQQAQSFKAGVATRAQVIASLGQPNGTSHLPDGSYIDVYFHVAAQPNGVDFVPVVGMLAGGASAQSNTATFIFDPNGVLKSVSTTTGNSNVNTGIANQK